MAISGTTSGPELLVELDRAAPEPLHRQLASGLRDAIRTGRLTPATRCLDWSDRSGQNEEGGR